MIDNVVCDVGRRDVVASIPIDCHSIDPQQFQLCNVRLLEEKAQATLSLRRSISSSPQ